MCPRNNCPYPYLKLKTMMGHHKKFFTDGVIFGVLAALIFNFSGCSSGSSTPAAGSNVNINTNATIDVDPDNNSDAFFWGGYTFDELMAMEDYEFETIIEDWTEDDWDMWARASAEYHEDQYLDEEDQLIYSVYTPTSPYYNDEDMAEERFLYRATCLDETNQRDVEYGGNYNYRQMMREYNSLDGLYTTDGDLAFVKHNDSWVDALMILNSDTNQVIALYFPENAQVAKGDTITIFGTLCPSTYLRNDREEECPGVMVYDYFIGTPMHTMGTQTFNGSFIGNLPNWLYDFWFNDRTYYSAADDKQYTLDGLTLNGRQFSIIDYQINAEKSLLSAHVSFQDETSPYVKYQLFLYLNRFRIIRTSSNGGMSLDNSPAYSHVFR